MKNTNEKLVDFVIDELNKDQVLVVISIDRTYSSAIDITSNTDKFHSERILELGMKAFKGEIGRAIEIINKVRDA